MLDSPSPGPCVGLEVTSTALEQNTSFPVAVAVDAGPQLVSGTIMQVHVCGPQPLLLLTPPLLSWLGFYEGYLSGECDAALGELIPVPCAFCMPSLPGVDSLYFAFSLGVFLLFYSPTCQTWLWSRGGVSCWKVKVLCC